MDFLDPKKKRAHLIRLYTGYGLMAALLVIGTVILAFTTFGYGIDRRTGNVIQNGLISLASHPEAVRILVNNEDKGSTSTRLVLPAGQYNVELRSDGYRSWSHKVVLEGGSIEQLVYPLLFPAQLITKTVQDFSAVPIMSSQSPDRRWLITFAPPAPGVFSLVDLNTPKHPIVTLALPSDTISLTAGDHKYEAIEWSSDNVHLLLKHSFIGGTEFIVLNREDPTKSVNINKLFPAQAFTSISLRDKKADQFYLLNSAGGLLYRVDTGSSTPTLLLPGVVSYKAYGADIVVYVTNARDKATTAEVRVSRGNEDYLLRNLPIAPKYLLEMTQFDGVFYLASGSLADGRTYLYKDPFRVFGSQPTRMPQPFRVMIVPGAQYVSFSANTRFVAVQGGSNFAVYDLETSRQFRYDSKFALSPDQKATWMDGHRLTLVSANKATVFDFDGTNVQVLGDDLPAFSPVFNTDYTAMFTLSTIAPDKTTLTRIELIASR